MFYDAENSEQKHNWHFFLSVISSLALSHAGETVANSNLLLRQQNKQKLLIIQLEMLTMQNEGKSNCQIIHTTTRFNVVMATT